jgi:hypothetical protein
MVDRKDNKGGEPESSGGRERQKDSPRGMESIKILREIREILELLKRGIRSDGDE